jgi:hypothetical protein
MAVILEQRSADLCRDIPFIIAELLLDVRVISHVPPCWQLDVADCRS